MKYLLIFLFLPVYLNAQVIFGINTGYDKTFMAGLKAGYKIENHSVYAQEFGTFKSDLRLSANYAYNLKSFEPFIGYGLNGLHFGLNKYFGNHQLTVGKYGDYKYFSVNYTTINVKSSDNIVYLLQFISGFSNGLHEAIQAGHWGTGRFWDNKISWKNKYKDFDNGNLSEAFPGSKSIFVSFTDGYHLTNLISHTANIATLVISIDGKYSIKDIIKKVLTSIIANRTAYFISYNIIFK